LRRTYSFRIPFAAWHTAHSPSPLPLVLCSQWGQVSCCFFRPATGAPSFPTHPEPPSFSGTVKWYTI
jgi:hypothetical protein